MRPVEVLVDGTDSIGESPIWHAATASRYWSTDASGRLWVGYWDGARVDRIDSDGEIIETVAVPARHATRACLGGPDGNQLFVTTGRYDLDAAELERRPHSGALFTAAVDATGVPPAEARL